jgi:NTP pyrophosphatase (non-canonical NTP hydrolase)
MMNTEQYLLGLVAEECAEVAHRASKAQRFGMDERQPGSDYQTNKERLKEEVMDLLTVLRVLGLLPKECEQRAHDMKKIAKINHYMDYSKKLGLLRP